MRRSRHEDPKSDSQETQMYDDFPASVFQTSSLGFKPGMYYVGTSKSRLPRSTKQRGVVKPTVSQRPSRVLARAM
jgi:hypothetical protein